MFVFVLFYMQFSDILRVNPIFICKQANKRFYDLIRKAISYKKVL